MLSAKIVKPYYAILKILGLEISCELQQPSVDGGMINVSAQNNASMFPTLGLVYGIDTNKIFFVDGNEGPTLRDGKLHLGLIVLCIHAGFVGTDGIHAIHAQALCNLIAEILIQVELDFKF